MLTREAMRLNHNILMNRTNVRTAGPLLAAGLVVAILLLALSWFLIDWEDAGSERYPGGTVLRDAEGDILRVTLGPDGSDCRPTYVAAPDDWIARAIVASEDGTFWTHCGVRPLSVLRAAGQNLTTRRRISGASTITMQAVRLIRPHPKTYWWKWKEAIMALKMERRRDKTWILSQYLNRAPFGSNFIGIEAAAQGWFGKDAKALGPGEAAMLAGLVQAPSRFRPDRFYDRALKRRDYVLGRMLALGLATPEQVAGARSVRPQLAATPRPFRAPFYCDYVLNGDRPQSQGDRPQSHGDRPSACGEMLTPLDPDVQEKCERAATAAAAAGHAVAIVVLHGTNCVALACADTDPKAAQVNTALAPRPAGSTLKPFLTALAFDRGLVTPDTRLLDVPVAYRGYRPANFDARHRGRVTVRDALVLSLNVPFVQLLREVGVTPFSDTLRALGFAHLGDDAALGLGLAIGNAEVTLVELARAYAAFMRRGGGVFSPGASWFVSDILSGEERAAAALGHVADVTLPRFAWKTGTSSAYRDAWTVLWNPDWVVAVWCGHQSGGFNDRTLVGAKAAAPVAWSVARQLCPSGRGPWFEKPPEVVPQRVCALTGCPAGPDCPSTEGGLSLRGRSSAALCNVHRRGPDGRIVVHEDAFLAAFSGALDRAAGLRLAAPEDGAVFTLVDAAARRVGTANAVLDQRIVCRPTGNPDGAKLWWFADGKPVGESRGSESFPIDLAAGEHEIVCATAEGVSASAHVTVRTSAP